MHQHAHINNQAHSSAAEKTTDTSKMSSPGHNQEPQNSISRLTDATGVNRGTYNLGNITVFAKSPVQLQPKITIHQPGDKNGQVMRMGAPLLQRKCTCGGTCATCRQEHNEDEHLQTKREGSNDIQQNGVPAIVHQVLQSPGQPLNTATRSFMEPRFGQDFSRVRIHTGNGAEASARTVHALAYTVGRNIVFGAGQFTPSTPAGRRLLAHELTHTLQQANTNIMLHPRLTIGDAQSPAEAEAEHTADLVMNNHTVSRHMYAGNTPVLRRQATPAPGTSGSEPDFSTPQRRGGQPRAAFIDIGQRGEDQVRVAVTRYLCDCIGRNVTRTRSSGQLVPGPGFTLEICNGRVTGRLTGNVVPNSLTTGSATVRGEVNVAPGTSGVGVRGGAEAQVRNTGTEPQVGGSVDLRVQLPQGREAGVSGSILRGTETGQVDTEIGAGADLGNIPGLGRIRIGGTLTNPQDPSRRGGSITLGGNLPGQGVQSQTCRECRCPAVYKCLEDVLPREYDEPVTYSVEDTNRLRYYFSLNTDQDTPDSILRGESQRMLDEVARRVAAGARIRSVTGYASPEDNREQPTPNAQLSLLRAKRLHQLLTARLGRTVSIPEPEAGGELLGRVATITPGSGLSNAILDAGFSGPEDVSTFLLGDDIPNQQLADQFLSLLARVTTPADRLSLFGVDAASPAAPRLLTAIDRFIANRGRGSRPWENIFGFLRFATVALATDRDVTYQEHHRTSGSLTRMNDTLCTPYARQAEREGLFGGAEPEPVNERDCPTGQPRNWTGYENECDYT